MRDYPGIAERYCRDVIAGTVVAGKWTRLACRRHLRDLERAADPTFAYTFSAWHASDVCDFIEKLPHVEGKWASPTITLEPWQVWLLVCVFGWRRKSDGGRRFEQSYIEVARKNAKSALTSGVSLYCLTCDGEVGPQIKTAATTGGQARIVFDVASKMARATPDLREAFGLEVMANSVVCHQNNGSIQPINAKSSTQDGLNPHLTVVDELHAHKDRSLFDVLRSATGARKNPLMWAITTAGYSTVGVCYEQRDYICKVLEGVVEDDTYFGVIYTLDEGDNPFDERVWPKANPNLNVSVDIEKMRAYARQAKNSPASEGEFRTKRLNLWQNSHSTWLSIEQWKACADTALKIDDFAGELAWIGIDLADTNDVAALLIVFEREGVHHAFARFYLPEDLVEICAHRTTTHYKVWADQGFITTTKGDFIDHNAIEQDIRALCEAHQVMSIRLEHYGSAQIAANLMEDGLPVEIVHKKPETYSEPAKLLEAWVEIKKFRFDGNPVLTWMASNCVVDRRVNGSILPKKEHKDSPKKIDGIDALIMAIGAATAGESRSAYDSDDRAEGILHV
ncbi:terminase large subunit [Bradyrhizobium sp. CCBAU 53338]|uniref:terminase large subunit n=1 Tax=Bradyrhizobium sp. CCBAU 53338 TaxID=1325111 RepID=UPI00188DB468|nr:terminase TerL endonuclease subunit [Bradyrhizobium sp. CCBAU 53338]QOZ52875.1 terminase large subunit [Bradyrhizobium sp. CCBAU 53338]